MNKSRSRKRWSRLLVWIIVVWHQTVAVVCERDECHKPFFSQLLSTSADLLKRSHQTFSHNFKSLIHQFQLRFTPPNLDFRSSGRQKGEESESVGESVKEAMKKSIRTSEATLQETARTAAKAVHKTADKVKKKTITVDSQSNNQESRDEL